MNMKSRKMENEAADLESITSLSTKAVGRTKIEERLIPLDVSHDGETNHKSLNAGKNQSQILTANQVQDLLQQFKATLESLRPLTDNKDLKDGIDRISESLNNEGLSYEIRSKVLKIIKQTLLNNDSYNEV